MTAACQTFTTAGDPNGMATTTMRTTETIIPVAATAATVMAEEDLTMTQTSKCNCQNVIKIQLVDDLPNVENRKRLEFHILTSTPALFISINYIMLSYWHITIKDLWFSFQNSAHYINSSISDNDGHFSIQAAIYKLVLYLTRQNSQFHFTKY